MKGKWKDFIRKPNPPAKSRHPKSASMDPEDYWMIRACRLGSTIQNMPEAYSPSAYVLQKQKSTLTKKLFFFKNSRVKKKTISL